MVDLINYHQNWLGNGQFHRRARLGFGFIMTWSRKMMVLSQGQGFNCEGCRWNSVGFSEPGLVPWPRTRFLPWRRKYFNPKWSIGSEGVLVRKDWWTSAETLGRLGKTAGVEELDRDGDQIKYKKMWGDGPKEGWFSLYLQGEITARCFEDPSDEQWVCRPQKWDTSKLPFNYQTSAEIEIQDNDAMWSKIRDWAAENYKTWDCILYIHICKGSLIESSFGYGGWQLEGCFATMK